MLVLILLTDIDPHLLQEESKTCPRDSFGLKRRKADHIVLEIPVNGDVYTFLIDDRKKY